MLTTSISRRTFLKATTAGIATFAIGRPGFAANSKLHHACIGVGGMGFNDLQQFVDHPGVEIIAICDVDKSHLAKAAALVPNARRYTDWRELFSKEGTRIDSVNIAVPDHMHAPITMTALHARKHLYCQKPLCHDVTECRAVARAAAAAGVVTQLGTQFASGIGDRMMVDCLREEVIGKVKRIITCSNRASGAQYRLEGPRPAQGTPVPEDLAWDLWLGTAPVRPYAPEIYHPMKWRAWQDFGTGWSGDIGCHIFSAVWLGLGLTAPRTVIAEVQESWKNSPARRADTWPHSDHITWVFPGNEKTEGKEVSIEWFYGEIYPPEDIRKMSEFENYPEEAAMVIGTEGAVILPHQSGPRLLPSEKFKGRSLPKLPPRNHYHHFADACLGGPMTESNFSVTGPMAEAILLGTVGIREPGTLLQWDATRMRFRNAPQANRHLQRRYRDGWRVRGL